jgi:hypothetical protein
MSFADEVKWKECRGCILIPECSVKFIDTVRCPCSKCLVKMICAIDCKSYIDFRDDIDSKSNKWWNNVGT